jgi:hypothetical protein
MQGASFCYEQKQKGAATSPQKECQLVQFLAHVQGKLTTGTTIASRNQRLIMACLFINQHSVHQVAEFIPRLQSLMGVPELNIE